MSKLTAYDKFVQQALKYAFSLYGTTPTSQIIVDTANDDGTYQAGYPKSGDRYELNDDGTVTDRASGLMWVSDPSVIGGVWGVAGTPAVHTWPNSLINAKALTYAGHSDWRVPNQVELYSLLDFSKGSPRINVAFFPNTQGLTYWSSTTRYDDALKAWQISFGTALVTTSTKTGGRYIRPVRLGNTKA